MKWTIQPSTLRSFGWKGENHRSKCLTDTLNQSILYSRNPSLFAANLVVEWQDKSEELCRVTLFE
jgi:hypothetical protein